MAISRVDDRMHLRGELTALHIKQEGLRRADRQEVAQTIDRLRGRMIEQMDRTYGNNFAPERVLPIPDELKDRIAGVRHGFNTMVTDGSYGVVDCWQGIVQLDRFHWHMWGTSSGATTTGMTNLSAPMTAETTPANLRSCGTLVEGAAANILQSVATLTVWTACRAGEWGFFASSGTASTMWSRVPHGLILLSSGDSVQYTYNLTV